MTPPIPTRMGGAILESSNSASLATAVLIPDTAAKLVRQHVKHAASAEIIPTAAASTDTAWIYGQYVFLCDGWRVISRESTAYRYGSLWQLQQSAFLGGRDVTRQTGSSLIINWVITDHVIFTWWSCRQRCLICFLHVDLETCSKVIEDGAIGQNTYDFLLVFCTNYGRISYHFCAAVDFVPKWHCWATVTSK